jgi:hypothetical protein
MCINYERELLQIYFPKTFILNDFLKEFFSLNYELQKNIFLGESFVCLTDPEPKFYSAINLENCSSLDVYLLFLLVILKLDF